MIRERDFAAGFSSHRRFRLVVGLLLTALVLLAGCKAKKPLTDEKAVQTGKESLGQKTLGSKQFPWYSPTTDDACFVPFPEVKVKENQPERDLNLDADYTFLGALVKVLIYMFILILLIPIVYFLILAVMRLSGHEWNLKRRREAEERQRRIETLPEEAREVYDDLLGAAEKAFRDGDYRRTLIYYFSYQLVLLDKSELIHMLKGKTNHEYLRELAQATGVRPFYHRAMQIFENVYYGEYELVTAEFFPIWEERHVMHQAVLEERKKREQNTPSLIRNTMLLLLIVVTGFLMFAGCQSKGEDVDTRYAPYFDRSLNGTMVFRDMCEKSGCRLGTGGALAEQSDYQVLVWFSLEPNTPPQKTLDTLDEWLEEKPDRTVVYVGRAFEATWDYWETMHSRIDEEENKRKINSKRSEAESERNKFLAKKKNPLLPDKPKEIKDPKKKGNSLFVMTPLEKEYKMRSLVGSENWLRDIDLGKVRFSLFEQMTPAKTIADDDNQETPDETTPESDENAKENEEKELPPQFEVLLESEDGHWIVASTPRKKGRMILVNNGGFLLNYQLINHEHRKLANRLIHEFGEGRKKVFILYSDHDIYTYDLGDRTHQSSFDTVLKFLQAWPVSILFWQCILLGILFCFYKWPIMGRPRKLPQTRHVDFMEHISAYADLLSATGEEIYVRKQVKQFWKNQGEEPSEEEAEVEEP